MKKILIESYVDSIRMPENVRIGLMISELRKKCIDKKGHFDYYGFAFGQSPFHIPEPIVQALKENAERGKYSDAQGITDLRRAISGFNRRHFQLDVEPRRVFVGPGSKEVIQFIFNIIQGGVIIPSPSWIGYYPLVKLREKQYYTYHLKQEYGYKIQPHNLEEFVSYLHGEQHILVINNPHNPTGALYAGDELEAIADVCRRHNILVLSDEIYALTTYDFEKFTSMGKVYPEGTFVTGGLSKDRSAGGYRLGYCILPENSLDELIEDFDKVAATIYTNVSTPIQYAAITAYEPNEEIEEYFTIIRNIHRIMGTYFSRAFNSIEGLRSSTPCGGFYFFTDFNELKPILKKGGVMVSNDLARVLLTYPYHIATVTGDSIMIEEDDFGARIAFVDYDGKGAYYDFKDNPPKTPEDETKFVEKNAPRMVEGVEVLRRFVGDL